LPHQGKWNKSHIWTAGTAWAEPLVAVICNSQQKQANAARSFIVIDKSGFEISSMTYNQDTLLVRLYNAEGDASTRRITFNGKIKKAQLIELSGTTKEDIKIDAADGKSTALNLAIPPYGIRTLKLTGIQTSKY
jgi:alpha-mannosidase